MCVHGRSLAETNAAVNHLLCTILLKCGSSGPIDLAVEYARFNPSTIPNPRTLRPIRRGLQVRWLNGLIKPADLALDVQDGKVEFDVRPCTVTRLRVPSRN